MSMSGSKKRYTSTADYERDYNRKHSIKNIKLAGSYTKRKFSGAVNILEKQGFLHKKSVEMIKHLYDRAGKGERGVLIKHVVAGTQGPNKSQFLKNLNKDILTKGYSKVVIETKEKLGNLKYKDNEGSRYYHELAKAYAKGKTLTKYERIKLQKKVEREVYNARMKAALKRPDLSEAVRKLLEDSLKARGAL